MQFRFMVECVKGDGSPSTNQVLIFAYTAPLGEQRRSATNWVTDSPQHPSDDPIFEGTPLFRREVTSQNPYGVVIERHRGTGGGGSHGPVGVLWQPQTIMQVQNISQR